MRVRLFAAFSYGILLTILATVASAQQGKGNECTIAGTWYGGSVVAYQMTIVPSGPAGHYTMTAQGMYKTSIMNTAYSGTLKKEGKKYVGSGMALDTQDPEYLNPPPFQMLPDLIVGWFSMELVDCNTIRNAIPFLGTYLGIGVWLPGSPASGITWVPGGKVPLADSPDIDMIPILTGDTKPIVETYHRLPTKVNPALLHH